MLKYGQLIPYWTGMQQGLSLNQTYYKAVMKYGYYTVNDLVLAPSEYKHISNFSQKWV